MAIDPVQLRDFVIIPALNDIGLHSDVAVNLMLGTAATESQCGTWLRQVNGPALGIYQMEPTTFNDLWWRFPQELYIYRGTIDPYRLQWDLRAATIFSRIKYYLDKRPLPNNDKVEIARYWKAVYNTDIGKGSTAKFLEDVERWVRNAWLG